MSEEKHKHHKRLPRWPEFAFPNNKIDGLLPSCRVDSWEHFIQCMRNPNHHGIKQEMVYRGQRRYDWGLSSTLSREYGGGAIKDEDREQLLDKFSLAMRGRGAELKGLPDEEIWAYGQHHGLCTPLLDWSKSPLVALYFAFLEPDNTNEKEDKENTSRAIFCLDKSRLSQVIPDLFYEPKTNEHARLVSQDGLFTMTLSEKENFVSYIIRELTESEAVDFDGFEDVPTNKDNEMFPIDETATKMSQYLCKIHIPNADRENCLAALRQMNIHHGNLFPDPYGATSHTNDWLRRRIAENHKEKDRKEQEREAISVPPIRIATPIGRSDLIVSVQETIRASVGKDTASDNPVEEWAHQVIKRYRQLIVPDWPIRTPARAKIVSSITRQLKLLGAGPVSRELAELLVNLFEADYHSQHQLTFNGNKGR